MVTRIDRGLWLLLVGLCVLAARSVVQSPFVWGRGLLAWAWVCRLGNVV